MIDHFKVRTTLFVVEIKISRMFVFYICFSAAVESQSNGTYAFQKPEDGNVCNTDVLLEPQDIVGGQACVKVG